MNLYDPPADPFGTERQCPICSTPLEYDAWTKTWYCPADHDTVYQDPEESK